VSGSLAALTSVAPTRPPGWLAPAAGGVPFAYYLAAASAHGGLYEEGTFIAAARSLGVAHPPGAPITTLVSALCALLPVGPLSFRVAVGCALCASLTLALFARALFFSLLGVGVRQVPRAGLLALAASWFVAQTPLFVEQATRANAYALQFALALVVIDALVRFELSEPTDDRRTLYFAAFAQGLSFANHHVFGLLMLSVAAPTLGRVFARRGFIGLMGHVAVPIVGFSAWVFVPIRGGRSPFIDIGEPSSLTRTFWALTADPWWGPSDAPAASALARLRDGLSGGHGWLALALLALALLGLLLGSRVSSQRRFTLIWVIALVVPLASSAWIIEPKLESDGYGALVPCALAAVALASIGLGLAVQRNSLRFERPLLGGHLVLAAVALIAVIANVGPRGQAQYSAPDALDDLSRRSLPTRSVVLTRDAGSWFRLLGSEAEEQLRADVTLVPLDFLAYPRALEALIEQNPELLPVLDPYSKSQRLPAGALRGLSQLRPTLIELDRQVSPALYPLLESAGLYERVLERRPLALDPLLGQRRTHDDARLLAIEQNLTPASMRAELRQRLGRVHFFKGLVAANQSERARAQLHVAQGLAFAPDDAALLRLQIALQSTRPVDASAMLRFGGPEDE
jgi:hypothetical protein